MTIQKKGEKVIKFQLPRIYKNIECPICHWERTNKQFDFNKMACSSCVEAYEAREKIRIFEITNPNSNDK